VQRIKRYTAGGALLDVGGGSGRFLKFVKDNYPEFEPTLVEVDEELCRVARDVFGLEAHNGTVEQLASSGRKFDAVVSIATIEHVFDPASYLATIRSAMNAGGVLYLTGPRLGPLTRTLTTSAAYDVIPPVHLNFFDSRSLAALVRTNDIALTIADTFQSHGPVFHFGHVFCKQNYVIEDVVMEDTHEDPLRVYAYRDDSRLTKLACSTLDAATRVLNPVIRLVDGQRVGQFLLRAT
jgi:SAM-dependent methyltransferase